MQRLLFMLTILVVGNGAMAQCDDLFFSEYIEGSSSNKALEIYNPTSGAIDLNNYEVHRFNNGGTTPSGTYNWPLGSTVNAGDVYVIANPSANASILALADTTSAATFFNGDDALALINVTTGDTVDIIGEIGVDPGASWTVGTGTTQNFTLIRQIGIQEGQLTWAFGSTEWDVFAIDMIDSLGAHTMTPCVLTGGCSDLFFSEYIEGSSSNKALEIFNPTALGIDLNDYVVYRFNNGSVSPTDSLFPAGILAGLDVFVAGNPSANASIIAVSDTTHTITFFNGDDALALVKISTGDTLDVIGEVGVDPGSGWPVGTGATNNFSLIRQIGINEGETDWTFGVTEWDVFPIDMVDSLGAHTMSPCGPTVDPTVTLASASQTVSEGIGTVTVTLLISDPNASATSVDVILNTGSSTATNGADFTFTSPTTVTFPGGSSASQSVVIPITDDALLESLEDIVLDLGNPTNNATIGTISTHTITIDDNELAPGFGSCSDLFFSEYAEGSSNNKALEIYNPTCNPVDLGDYQVQRFTNGSMTASGTYTFPTGTMLASQDVYVIGNASADSVMLINADTTNAATFFNGDDAISLMNLVTGDTLDIIGEIGIDPGTNWTVGTGATSEFTLIRTANVHDGTTDWSVSIGQWDVFPQNMWDSLGAHYATQCNDTLIASFTIQDTVTCIGNQVCFTNTSTGGGCNKTYLYDFGDGNTSTLENPCHTYASAGFYLCSLVVNDGTSISASIVQVEITTSIDASITSGGGQYCSSDSPFTMTAANPGGLWTGTGITDSNAGTFDPGTAGAGAHTVYYTISGTCGNMDSVVIDIVEPAVSFGALDTLCDYNAAITLTQGAPVGGTYSGTGVSGNTFDPAVAGLGTHTLTYMYTDSSGCINSSTSDIVVDDCAGISELELTQISLFPNPAEAVITIESNATIERVEIIDVTGEVVLSTTQTEISVSNLANGMYIARVWTNTGSASKRFVKE